MVGSDGKETRTRLLIVAFVGVVGTGVVFGLCSEWGATAATRESRPFREVFVDRCSISVSLRI